MLKYHSPTNGKVVTIVVLTNYETNAVSNLAEGMLAKAIEATNVFPAAGDILQPLPGVRLTVLRREFELREEEVFLWIHTEPTR